MEAAVASGILKIVGNKLVPLLMKEYSSIVGAKKDLQELHGQVVEINSWLESVGDKVVGNDPSFSWLKQLKNIAYDVDDIVDELQLKAEKHEATASGGIVSKYLCNKPKSIIFQCKAASKIKAIKKEFAGIVKQRKDFSIITNSLSAGHPVHHVNMTVGEMPLLPNIDAASVLGRDKDKDDLISKLNICTWRNMTESHAGTAWPCRVQCQHVTVANYSKATTLSLSCKWQLTSLRMLMIYSIRPQKNDVFYF